jgi:hypothetical protein
MLMTSLKIIVLIPLFAILLTGCEQDVLTFPDLEPAHVRIVNTTQDVEQLNVVVDRSSTVTAARGAATGLAPAESGRLVSFVLKDGDKVLGGEGRDTVYYILGGGAKVILFARGSTSNVVEFRRAIQDTTLSPNDDPVIRFTHMAEQTDRFVTLEVWFKGGEKVFDAEFDPGLSSTYVSLPPGTYSFELREWGGPAVAAELVNVELKKGTSYMLYAWDAAPPTLDAVSLSIF